MYVHLDVVLVVLQIAPAPLCCMQILVLHSSIHSICRCICFCMAKGLAVFWICQCTCGWTVEHSHFFAKEIFKLSTSSFLNYFTWSSLRCTCRQPSLATKVKLQNQSSYVLLVVKLKAVWFHLACDPMRITDYNCFTFHSLRYVKLLRVSSQVRPLQIFLHLLKLQYHWHPLVLVIVLCVLPC